MRELFRTKVMILEENVEMLSRVPAQLEDFAASNQQPLNTNIAGFSQLVYRATSKNIKEGIGNEIGVFLNISKKKKKNQHMVSKPFHFSPCKSTQNYNAFNVAFQFK